jgi:ABC-2 type transport system ATP-binding protein
VAWSLIEQMRGRGTTVVLVTHHMDEAQRLCDRLVVIDGGRVLATGNAQQLIASCTDGIRIRFSTDRRELSFLRSIDAVHEVTRRGAQVEVRGRGPVLALVGATLVEHGIVPGDLRVEQPTLEDAYMHLTQPVEKEKQ